MRLLVSDKYPQVYRLATEGPQNSVPSQLGAFVGLPPPNKASDPKLECETLEISFFMNPYSVLPCSLWTEQYLPLLRRITSSDHFRYVLR